MLQNLNNSYNVARLISEIILEFLSSYPDVSVLGILFHLIMQVQILIQ